MTFPPRPAVAGNDRDCCRPETSISAVGPSAGAPKYSRPPSAVVGSQKGSKPWTHKFPPPGARTSGEWPISRNASPTGTARHRVARTIARDTVSRLLGRLSCVRQTGPGRWIARCRAHEDRSPSLSIRDIDDRVLVHTFAGCGFGDVLSAVGLTLADLYGSSGLPAKSLIQPGNILPKPAKTPVSPV